ncbi:MAG: hypothetical protein ACE5FM_06975, partial [Methyloligellaceae bacterium]
APVELLAASGEPPVIGDVGDADGAGGGAEQPGPQAPADAARIVELEATGDSASSQALDDAVEAEIFVPPHAPDDPGPEPGKEDDVAAAKAE